MKKREKECKNVKGQTWPYFGIKRSHILVFWDRAKREGEEKRREEEEGQKGMEFYGFCMECIEPCIDTCLVLGS